MVQYDPLLKNKTKQQIPHSHKAILIISLLNLKSPLRSNALRKDMYPSFQQFLKYQARRGTE